MPRAAKINALALFFLIAFPFIYFFPVTIGQSVWLTRDISRVYHPFAVELARALSEGRLPFWTPYLQAGFPLVAEGQIAAFYPLQLLMVRFIAPHFAISYEMLVHLAFAAVGMYACARLFVKSTPSAFLAGFVFSFNGFMIQKLYHTPILLTAAWLPWMIFLSERWQRAQENHDIRTSIWFLLTVFATALSWLAGSAQIALLNSITLAVFGFVARLYWNRPDHAADRRFLAILRAALWTALPIILGTAIAAIQLAPTVELLSYSTRAGGLDERLLTLYSYSRDSLAQFIFPFSQGEPSDDNVELWGYIGVSTLLLAIWALRLRRDSRTVFLSLFALTALSLTLGGINPLFRLLSELPVLNLFRVPARYVFLFSFAAALLAATAFDEIAQKLQAPVDRNFRLPLLILFPCAILVFGVIWLAYAASLEFWLTAWNILPWIIGTLAVILMSLGWARRIGQYTFQAGMIGLLTFDLSAYTATFLSTTVAQLTPAATITQAPRSVQILGSQTTPERIITDETIWPSVPALRASLYPNFGMLYGREMAHAYTPLWFEANQNYFFALTPQMLNLMNVRYFFIPLEPRFTDRNLAPADSFALDVVNNKVQIPPMPATSIQIDSIVEDTSTLTEGTTVAELDVQFDDGVNAVYPLRVGFETGDWDHARKNTGALPVHSARTIPGFVRSYGRTFDANVYRAQFSLSPGHRVTALNVRTLIPASHITIEQITLVDENGKATTLASLTGKNELMLRYISDTVVVWENRNVMPRAFIVHSARVENNAQAFDDIRHPGFHPEQVVLLEHGQPLLSDLPPSSRDHVEITHYAPEQVTISAESDRAGYLVLADTYYPGWNAMVDGREAPIYRADYIFRAVPIEAGKHSVTFEYRPISIRVGIVITSLSFSIAIAVSLFLRNRNHRR